MYSMVVGKLINDMLNAQSIIKSGRMGGVYDLGLIPFLKQYSTIKFDIGRQVGKTHWVGTQNNDYTCVVFLKHDYRKDFKNKFTQFNWDDDNTFSIHQDILSDKPFKTVIFDNASFMKENDIDLVLSKLNLSDETTIIRLG